MTRKNLTRNALFTSIISLLLCVSMLVGTTFAWFTDSVASGSNVITSGNLDIAVEYTLDGTTWKNLNGADDLFSKGLWEPGHTEVVALKIENKGTLALQYIANMNIIHENAGTNVKGEEFFLSDILTVSTLACDAADVAGAFRAEDGVQYQNTAAFKSSNVLASNQKMTSGETHYMVIKVDMDENVGNEANHNGADISTIQFGLNILASQVSNEIDSFGSDYDANAAYPGAGSGHLGANSASMNIQVYNKDGSKVGALEIPKSALKDPEKPSNVEYDDSSYVGNFTVAAGMETKVVDIKVDNLKEDNTAAIKVIIVLPAMLDPDTVKVYHYDAEVADYDYNPRTGLVSFTTTSFSPFTVVYDAESEFVAPSVEGVTKPKAEVTDYTDIENIEWASYGQWAPTAGLEAKLEKAYKFTCPETAEQAAENPYAYWYCDFYVSLDRDLGTNQLFLGGNYGDFGWVGFHNGDLNLPANQERALLGSVTNNPWTYLDVADFVGEFICGVGDVDNALRGATFTVHLRLTNPENEDEFYNVNTVKYTFN